MAARFITFEGGEGCGKSTQLRLLSASMKAAGIAHITTREPGGTPLGEELRELLVRQSDADLSPETELLLFQAGRMAHLEQVIRPALAEGKWVLCDRFTDSTRVYQGIGKRLGMSYIDRLQALTLGTFAPDITLLLDIAPEAGLARAGNRKDGDTRFEELDIAFHQQVRDGFLALANAEPERFIVVDAHPSVEEVHAAILTQLNTRLGIECLQHSTRIVGDHVE